MRRLGRDVVRLLVVFGLVGLLVVTGMGWRSSSLASLISDDDRDHRPGREQVDDEGDDDEGEDDDDREGGTGGGLDIEGFGALAGTMSIGAVTIGAVVGVDTVRRRRRPTDPRRRL